MVLGMLFATGPILTEVTGTSEILDWASIGVSGLLAIVVVAMIVVFLKVAKNNAERQKIREQADADRLKSEQDRLTKMLSELFHNTNHVHSKQDEEDGKQLDIFVTTQLNNLLLELNCSRSYFVIYHNGVWSNSGLRLPKMSISGEAVNIGVSPIMPQLQSMPRTFLTSLDLILEKEGNLFCKEIQGLEQTDAMSYSWFKSHNCKTVMIAAVRDEGRGYLVGFIAVEFNSRFVQNVSDKEFKLAVSKVAERISGAFQVVETDEDVLNGMIKKNKEE